MSMITVITMSWLFSLTHFHVRFRVNRPTCWTCFSHKHKQISFPINKGLVSLQMYFCVCVVVCYWSMRPKSALSCAPCQPWMPLSEVLTAHVTAHLPLSSSINLQETSSQTCRPTTDPKWPEWITSAHPSLYIQIIATAPHTSIFCCCCYYSSLWTRSSIKLTGEHRQRSEVSFLFPHLRGGLRVTKSCCNMLISQACLRAPAHGICFA